MRCCRALGWVVAFACVVASTARADEPPEKWEQLFFPFPIVGAPPQLEQQVQLFNSYFTGTKGQGDVVSAELAYIATPHLGLVVTVPFQIGWNGQPSGFGDVSFLAQYLVAGSLRLDDMVSAGLQVNLPTAPAGLGGGDWFLGPFVFAAQRFFHRLVFEVNATGLFPLAHGDSSRLVVLDGMASVLVTPLEAEVPIYVQCEAPSTFLFGGAPAPGTPDRTLFLVPEIFVGPFRSPLSAGTRLAAGVAFNVVGDPARERTLTVTAAFDLPNPYGY